MLTSCNVKMMFTNKTELKKIFKSACGKNVESYNLFIEQALKQLTVNGQLAFVLPEAILHVKAHTPIRELLLHSGSIKNLVFLGNVFDGVLCPCIILDFQATGSPLSMLSEQKACKVCEYIGYPRAYEYK